VDFLRIADCARPQAELRGGIAEERAIILFQLREGARLGVGEGEGLRVGVVAIRCEIRDGLLPRPVGLASIGREHAHGSATVFI